MIAIDMDGVLADFVYGFTSLGHRMFGLPVYSAHWATSWDMTWYAEQRQLDRMWQEVVASDSFWLHLPPLVTRYTLDRIAGASERMVFVTTRPGKTAQRQTVSWLRHYLHLDILSQSVLVTQDKRALVAPSPGVELAVDDNPTLWAPALLRSCILMPKWSYNSAWHDLATPMPDPDTAVAAALSTLK